MHLAITYELDVQRYGTLDVWLRSTFSDSDRSAHCRRRSRLRQSAGRERPGVEDSSRKTVALLRHCFHKVGHESRSLRPSLTTLRTSCAEGIPPLAESFFDGDERDREDMVPYLPADLQYLHKVYIILMRAMVAMGKTNLQSIHCDVRVLRSLISIFDSQLLSLVPSSPSDLGKRSPPD